VQALKSTVNDINLIATGWATRGFPRRPPKKSKVHTLISSCGSTKAGPLLQKRRTRVVDGVMVTSNFERAQPQVLQEYFEVAKAVDVHNHYRQSGLALERNVQTKSWFFRLFCTILGIIEVDAYFAYLYDRADSPEDVMDHLEFTKQLAKLLFDNPYKRDHIQRRKRNREEDGDIDAVQAPHVLLPLSRTKYFEALRARQPNEKNNCNRRCQKCGKKASYYCQQCSTDDEDKKKCKFEAYCGPTTDRRCFAEHIESISP
jgi:hypothetical protein